MDSFELNKIFGAVLGTLLFVMGVGFLAEAIYHPIEGRGPGYELPEPELTAAAGLDVPEAAPVAIAVLLASASAEDGRAAARKCQSCHSFDEGGPNGQGPNLWDIVNRPIAGYEGFSYSEALIEHAAVAGTWTYEQLNPFLLSPKGDVPGTKMNFAGVRDDEERADIIAFLATLSNNPVPYPEPEEALAEAEGEGPGDAVVPTVPTGEDTAEPAAEGEAAPAVVTEPATTETPDTPATDTPVVGTPTNSNTPAGASPETNPAAMSAPAAEPMAPAATQTPATPAPATTTTTAPVTPAPTTTTTTTAPATPAPATTTTTTAQ